MSRLEITIDAKKEKLQKLRELGLEPYPYIYDKKDSIAACLEKKGATVQTAGRVMAWRAHGKVIFADLMDQNARIQIMLHADRLTPQQWTWLALVDPGDFLGVTGTVDVTKTGELTIIVTDCTFLGKSLRPLPSVWNAAEDKEARFRKRYLDMLVNPEAKRILDARWLILRELRRYLTEVHGFTEVETPILQPLYGGTSAKPFTSHMNALDCDFYLRIAPELYLKRLIVGGMERIFEIARNFRNEGIDQTHQPEFTMIEWYEAYADYHRNMEVIEGLIRHLNQAVNGRDKLMVGDTEVDLGAKWPCYTMNEALTKFEQIDPDQLSDAQLADLLAQHNFQLIGEFSRGKAIFALFDELVCHQLITPTWIIDYPKEVSPLSKAHRLNPDLTERYELYIGGKELSDGWSEITDATDQRSRFENEQAKMRAGDAEAQPTDEEFLEAMEYGLPPLGGVGLGIDRLVMLLTNTLSIKEVIAFPTLRPLNRPVQPVQTEADRTPEKPNSGDDKVVFNKETAGEMTTDETVPTKKTATTPSVDLPDRQKSQALLEQYVQDPSLRDHCHLVAEALAAYACQLGEDEELWYQTGLLHDIDFEKFPEEHPLVAVNEYLVEYPAELRHAVHSHGYGTKMGNNNAAEPTSALDKYITAVDELSGFLRAMALIRPNGYADLKLKSVKKALKNKSFAAAINRDDIEYGAQLIETPLDEHIEFMIAAFQKNRAQH